MTRTHRFAVAVAAVGLLAFAYVAGQRSASGQTQTQMNIDSYRDFQKADAHLNVVYKKFLKSFGTGPDSAVTHKKIVAAQRAWIAYRDADSEMEASVEGEGGTIYPLIVNSTAASLTNERSKDLSGIMKDMNSR